MNAFFQVPKASNEPVLPYLPGSPERQALKAQLAAYKAQLMDIPMVIGGQEVRTGALVSIHPPHELSHTLGHYHRGGAEQVKQAIDAALAAKAAWENLPWQERAAIFLRAAALLSGPYRAKLNAATMLCQSKNVFQAEIDAACELIDFFRFNVEYMAKLYQEQPSYSPLPTWNRLEYRALEGFIFAVTPFNFTSICANLCAAPAMMGNVVVWKPSDTQIYSAKVIMDLFKEAGLPDGVINLVYADGPVAGEVVFQHPDFAGLHFTGSTKTFQHLWKTIGQNIHLYKSYPRIVGETGGKDFVIAHPSADAKAVAVGLSRGAFEYQGQKCSAASRAYIPQSLWPSVEAYLKEDLAAMRMGSVEQFGNFINAVIDERAFDKITGYIQQAKADGLRIVAGGNFDKSKGYFIEPTVILATDPRYTTMCEELFGPVLTVYVYADDQYEQTLHILDQTSPYALTGAVFSRDRYAVDLATRILRHSAGNFYINDKPTGAVVGQQPFGGARGSGTNDKAGAPMNLLRWVSARTIKENFLPPTDFRYPFMLED